MLALALILGGQPVPRLPPTELVQLKAMVPCPPRQVGLTTGPWTGQGVAAFVKRALGTTISAATARRSLHRLGGGRQRPRTRFTRAQPAAQRAFAQALPQTAPPREPGRVTVSRDQGQRWPDVLPRLGWCRRGHPAAVDTTSPAKAAKVLCYGAVVRPLARVITLLCPWCSQAMTATWLAKLRRRLGGGQLAGFLDNAPSHQGPSVEAALARHQIRAHRLPP